MTAPFDYTEHLRLEIDDPTQDVGLRNLISDGTLGGYGWITPVGGTLAATLSTVVYTTRQGTANPQYIYSLDEPVIPGNGVTAWFNGASPADGSTRFYRARIEFLDLNHTLLSSAGLTGYIAGNVNGDTSATVPTGAAFARLRFDVYSSAAGANPTSQQTFTWLQPTLVTSSGPIAIRGPVQNGPAWRNVIDDAGVITVVREGLSVGTLATTFDADYDPVINPLIRAGRRVRLVAAGTEGDEILFTGKIPTENGITVTHDPANTDANSRVIVGLVANDVIADLANAPRPDGVGTVAGLRQVLEGARVPWLINGSSSQIGTQAIVARNDSATALDQVVVTRDTFHAHAWANRRGQLVVAETASMPGGLSAFYNEFSYGDDLGLAYDNPVINMVAVTLLRINLATGQTVEITRTYRDQASVDEWGPRRVEFRVQGIPDTDAACRQFANEVMTANATPGTIVNEITVPIEEPGQVVSRALIDLYERVRVDRASKRPPALSQTSRVTAITHQIDPQGDWTITLGFSRDSGVAIPQAINPLSSQATNVIVPTSWTTIAPAAPFTAVDGQAPQYRLDLAGNVHLRGAINRNTGASGATVFTLPAGLRPTAPLGIVVRTNMVAAVSRMNIATTGVVTFTYDMALPTATGIEAVFSTY